MKIAGSEVTVFVYNAGGMLVAEYSTEIEGVETAQVSYLTQDHLGSPRVVTGRDGEVLSRKDYSAFGEELVADEHRTENEEYGGGEVRKGYTGYEKDSESGLEFAQARYYNTIHGRFTSVDPLTASASIRNPQTFNRYSYVLNSPYKYSDPLGLSPKPSEISGFCDSSGSSCYDNWITGIGGFANPPEPPRHTNEAANPPATEPAPAAPKAAAQGNQQEAKEPDLPWCPSGHMCFGPQAVESRAADSAPSTLDVVFSTGNLFPTEGTEGGDPLPPGIPSATGTTDVFNQHRWSVRLFMILNDSQTRERWNDYRFAVQYDNPRLWRETVEDREKPSDSGDAFLGTLIVQTRGGDIGKPIIAPLDANTNLSTGGTVTVYSASNTVIGRTTFRIGVVGNGSSPTLEETSRLPQVWNRPRK